MYFQHIESIGGIAFTPREVDTISCIVHVRGMKKIAQILSISPRTVEGHIQNILFKISANSQESIKDFVEKSDELLWIRQHYIDLLINSFFEQELQKLKPLFGKVQVECCIDYQKGDVQDYLIKHLKFVGIEVLTDIQACLGDEGDKRTIIILSQDRVLEFQRNKNYRNIIFVCTEEERGYNLLQECSDIQVVDCMTKATIHLGIFRILEILAPNIDFSDAVLRFNKTRANVISLKTDINTSYNGGGNTVLEKQPIWSYFNNNDSYSMVYCLLKKKGWIFVAVICVCVMGFLFNRFWPGSSSGDRDMKVESVSYNFSLPHKSILLPRPDIIAKMHDSLEGREGVKTVVLIGGGGAGKTTLARQYAIDQSASILWEINAETKSSLMSSFEQLAYALCNTIEERQELNRLSEMKNIKQRENKLLLLTQKKLKERPNWLIIYDNVESFKLTQPYFPYNSNAWGSGKVIITTRNSNLKNNDYIKGEKMVEIEELTPEEKFKLFSSIIREGGMRKDFVHSDEYIQNFLEQIPSYPLDVSVAAYHIKITGISCHEYLKQIAESKLEFTALQEKILENVSGYSKTRYGIIALSVERTVQANPDFKDLMLFVTLLDSQDIPEELLIAYKDPVTVKEFINELRKNSLLTGVSSKNIGDQDQGGLLTFSMHRNTQTIALAYIIHSFNLNNDGEPLNSITNTLERYISDLAEAENVAKLKALHSHCEAVLTHGQDILNSESKTVIETALAEVLLYLGYDVKAKDILEKTILEPNQHQHSITLARTYSLLGNLYRRLGTFEKAEIAFNKSLAIYEQFPDQSLQAAKTLMHLGVLYRLTGDPKKAEIAFNRSLAIYERFPDQSLQAAKTSMYLGTFYRVQGEYDSAKKLLEKSFKIYNEYSKSSLGYARASTHLGVCYSVMGDYNKAQSLLEDGLSLYKQLRGQKHIDVAWVTVHLGVVYGRQGNTTEAINLIENSLKVYRGHFGDRHTETAKVINYLAEIYLLSNQDDQAEKLANEALEILHAKNHPEQYISLELLGDLYARKANYTNGHALEGSRSQESFKGYKKKAAAYFNSALAIANMNFDQNSENILKLRVKLNNIGNK